MPHRLRDVSQKELAEIVSEIGTLYYRIVRVHRTMQTKEVKTLRLATVRGVESGIESLRKLVTAAEIQLKMPSK